ncbi:MAG: TIGR01906 family membrane protein [Anaerolineaceae bacterium]|nr:TIGR01906 family membrane protein [Anaerolineaceae bacterium]
MTTAQASHAQSALQWLTRLYITLAFPFLVVLIFVRLIMSPLYLQFEYNRPDFPADYYGFTVQDRLTYAPSAIQYLLNGDDISFLADLRFPDGRDMYNTHELRHMRDVKNVTQYAFASALIGSLITLLLVAYLWRSNRKALWSALLNGSRLTIGIILAIVIIAVTSWDTFFTTFHQLFFAGGTWQFEYSDTLIRLFPEQFWFDASLIIGGATLLVALATMFVTIRQIRKQF